MDHPSDRSIIRLVSGMIAGRKAELLRTHISFCPGCGRRYERLLHILTPSLNTVLKPKPRLESKLLEILNTQKHTGNGEKKRSFLPLRNINSYPRPYVAFACIFLVVSLVIGLAVISDQRSTLPVSISYLKGRIYIDNRVMGPDSRIKENSMIRVPGNAALVLSFQNSLVVKIRGESIFKIRRSNGKKKNSLMGYTFEIMKGSLFARIDVKGKTPYFCYLTPDARIRQNRNEFILNVSEEGTTVITKNGPLQVTALNSKEEMELLPEKKYVIGYSIESNELNEQDEKTTDTLKNLDNPYRNDAVPGLLHLPDLPQEKI